jgi:Bacterial PH domain
VTRRWQHGRMAAERIDGGRSVYRPVFSRVLFGIFVAFAGWWVTAQAVGPAGVHAAVTGLWLLAVSAALAALFWRPAVVVDDAGVELRNVLRDVRVPWPALQEIETRYALTLHAGGRRFASWAAPAPGRPSTAGRLSAGVGATAPSRHDHAVPDPRWTAGGAGAAPASSRDLRADSGATAFMIEQRWGGWRESAAARTPHRIGDPGLDPRGGNGAEAAAEPGHSLPAADDGVQVRWRPVLPATAGAALAAALALTALLC